MVAAAAGTPSGSRPARTTCRAGDRHPQRERDRRAARRACPKRAGERRSVGLAPCPAATSGYVALASDSVMPDDACAVSVALTAVKQTQSPCSAAPALRTATTRRCFDPAVAVAARRRGSRLERLRCLARATPRARSRERLAIARRRAPVRPRREARRRPSRRWWCSRRSRCRTRSTGWRCSPTAHSTPSAAGQAHGRQRRARRGARRSSSSGAWRRRGSSRGPPKRHPVA